MLLRPRCIGVFIVITPYVPSISGEMSQALSVHVALEQRALVRPPRAGLHFISDAKPIAVVNLKLFKLSIDRVIKQTTKKSVNEKDSLH